VVYDRSSSWESPDPIYLRAFWPPLLTTTAFVRSSGRWFEAFSCKTASKGRPSSTTQLRKRAVCRRLVCSWRTQNLSLQIEPVRWRATLAGCTVMVHQHLDGTLSMTHGPHRLGHYSAQGVVIRPAKMAARRAVEKTRGGKVQKPTFPPRLEIPQTARDSHFPTAPTTAAINSNRTSHVLRKPDVLTC
jgi:hypothetical protein